jgi:guanylate kinase
MTKTRGTVVFIVSSPSGGGKTTIVEKLLAKDDRLGRSVSYTTRRPRAGEISGKDYIFISEQEFVKKAERGDFLEWEETFGNYYGTGRREVERMREDGKDVILTIDVKGARSVKKGLSSCVTVFIMPPSREELTERLKKRKTDSEGQLAVRMKEAAREMDAAQEYDHVVVNNDLDDAVAEVAAIVKKERKKR